MSRFIVVLATVVALGWFVAGCGVKTSDQTTRQREVATVPKRAGDVRPVREGTKAPVGRLRGVEGGVVNMADLYKKGPTVLVFYRGGWCPYCTEHLSAVGQAEAELLKMGYQVVAVSPDRPEELAKSVEKGALKYRLLSDSDMELSRAFGLAFEVDAATIEKYHGYGIDLEKASGRGHHWLPVPAVYLVGRDGVIRFAHWNPDYTKRLSREEILEAARGVREKSMHR